MNDTQYDVTQTSNVRHSFCTVQKLMKSVTFYNKFNLPMSTYLQTLQQR